MLLGLHKTSMPDPLSGHGPVPGRRRDSGSAGPHRPNNPLIGMSGRDSRANPPLCQLLAQLAAQQCHLHRRQRKSSCPYQSVVPAQGSLPAAMVLWNHSAGSWLFLAAQPWRSRIVSIVVSASLMNSATTPRAYPCWMVGLPGFGLSAVLWPVLYVLSLCQT